MKKCILLFFLYFVQMQIVAQWETVYFPIPTYNLPGLQGVAFSDLDHGTAVGNSYIIKTIDNGTTWDTVFYAADENFNDVIYIDSLTAYAVGDSAFTGIIAKTIDGGTTWTTALTSSANITSVSFPSSSYGYAAAYNGAIVKTTNAGTTWNTLTTPVVNNLKSVSFVNDSTGFISSDSIVLKTTDGGITWSTHQVLYGDFSSLSFPSDSIGYLMTSSFGQANIYKTIDQGNSWNLIYSMDTAMVYATSIFFVDDTTGYMCGEFVMYKTTDGGNTWTVQHSSLLYWPNFFDTVMDVFILNDSTGFAVGPGQFYRTPSSEEVSSVEDIKSNYTFLMYPKPSDGNMTLEYKLNAADHATMQLMDITGKQIANYPLDNASNKLLLNCTTLDNGIYFYRVIINNKTEGYDKLIVIK